MGEVDKKRYRKFYPHPAQGLDVEAARRRVIEHPEVMPPNPEPVRFGAWGSREILGMRYAGLFGAVALGLLAPLLLGMAIGLATSREARDSAGSRTARGGWWPGNARRRGSVLLLARR
ncbi:MAG TPA: hypothetical protein VN033_00205 [Vulgatibacter sp.]|nr:hypothetical protein [Vulgatibacter sp.]